MSTFSSLRRTAAGSGAAPLGWLVGKCQDELHCPVRLREDRPVGALVGDPQWRQLAASRLLAFVLECPRAFSVKETEGAALISLSAATSAAADTTGNFGLQPHTAAVCERVLAIQSQSCCSAVGMNLGRLLQDLELRNLLRGRGLNGLCRAHPVAFETVEVYQDRQRDGAWYVSLREEGPDAVRFWYRNEDSSIENQDSSLDDLGRPDGVRPEAQRTRPGV